MIGRVVGIILSHPFDVISVRMMAQFVGGETRYVWVSKQVKLCSANILIDF